MSTTAAVRQVGTLVAEGCLLSCEVGSRARRNWSLALRGPERGGATTREGSPPSNLAARGHTVDTGRENEPSGPLRSPSRFRSWRRPPGRPAPRPTRRFPRALAWGPAVARSLATIARRRRGSLAAGQWNALFAPVARHCRPDEPMPGRHLAVTPLSHGPRDDGDSLRGYFQIGCSRSDFRLEGRLLTARRRPRRSRETTRKESPWLEGRRCESEWRSR
jgi:hypothetical protein